MVEWVEWRRNDSELQQMLENSREAVRRSQELIAQTEELLQKSRILMDTERSGRPGWKPDIPD